MKLLRLFPFILFATFALFLWRGLSLNPQLLPSVKVGQSLPDFQLPSLGSEQLFTPESLGGKVALLNIWASWCEACIDEQALLLRLAREGIPIYGLNYKDKTQVANHWLRTWGNPYRAIGEDKEGKLAIDLGVYGTPETFLIDKKGTIRFRHVGALDEKIWESELLPLMKQLQEER